MNVLAFDTCLDKTYISLYSNKNICNKVINSNENNYHSAYLISSIVNLLKENNLTPNDIDYFATDIGPGSFTGIRACVTVARMLAQQLDKKVIGVSSLEILSKISGEEALVLLDARKNKAYVYDNEIKGAINIEEALQLAKNRVVVTDNSLYEMIKPLAKETISYQNNNYPLGEILLNVSLKRINDEKSIVWQELKPLYIQPPPIFGR